MNPASCRGQSSASRSKGVGNSKSTHSVVGWISAALIHPTAGCNTGGAGKGGIAVSHGLVREQRLGRKPDTSPESQSTRHSPAYPLVDRLSMRVSAMPPSLHSAKISPVQNQHPLPANARTPSSAAAFSPALTYPATAARPPAPRGSKTTAPTKPDSVSPPRPAYRPPDASEKPRPTQPPSRLGGACREIK